MTTVTETPTGEPIIVMTRVYEAPRELVWQAMTEARHVRLWWGGPGFTNPVCEMDVRPGGLWTQVMRFPDGRELHLAFIFLEVEEPLRLVWQNSDYGKRKDAAPAARVTVTLEDVAGKTRWTMVARFRSMEQRAAAVAVGFSAPIAVSSERLVAYLKTM
jgi:uncharacterized protein YndB with AHSA1/START domain